MRLVSRSGFAPKVAVLLAALALSGCVGSLFTSPPPETYDLQAPSSMPKLRGHTTAQILVPAPSALKILDSQRIVVQSGPVVAYYPNAQYPDTLPRVLQSRVIEAFEQTKQARAVGKPGEGLSIDYQLLLNVRTFQFVSDANGLTTSVEIAARIMNDRDGRIVAFRVFDASVPVQANTAPAVVAALNDALDQVLVDLVRWTVDKV